MQDRAITLHITRELEEFAARAEPLLAGRIEHNQLATTVIKARRGAYGAQEPLYVYGCAEDGTVTYAALRTPPWPMLTAVAENLDCEQLIRLWLAVDEQLPGIIGETRTAASIAFAWERITGGQAVLSTRSALHVLSQVIEPSRPAGGRLRLAEDSERARLIEWERGFLRDAHIRTAVSEGLTDARLAEGAQFIWDDGRPVSTVVVSPPVAGTVRLGPVYTPPPDRGRGYATSAVAAVCRRMLASGAERCALFTDLSNPTSNRIYAEVGFQRIADWAEYHFERPPD